MEGVFPFEVSTAAFFSRLGGTGIFWMPNVLPPVLGFEHKTGYARAFIHHFGGKFIALEF
jgi:hypothetical protein